MLTVLQPSVHNVAPICIKNSLLHNLCRLAERQLNFACFKLETILYVLLCGP